MILALMAEANKQGVVIDDTFDLWERFFGKDSLHAKEMKKARNISAEIVAELREKLANAIKQSSDDPTIQLGEEGMQRDRVNLRRDEILRKMEADAADMTHRMKTNNPE